MFIHVFCCGPFGTNALVIQDDRHAVIVDPSAGSQKLISHCVSQNQLSVEKILLTHSHWDHIVDCAALKREFVVPVWVHRLDAPNLQAPGIDQVPIMWPEPIEGVEPDDFLEEGQIIAVGKLEWQVLHTPGHCPGLVCFYCAQEGILIPGDLFFRGAMGHINLPTADEEAMWDSLARVAKLPKETVVYPGHGQKTTIGAEAWLENAREVFG